MKNIRLLFIALCMVSLQFAFANHDEATDGDLSNDPQAPTVIQVVDGSNIVCASSVNANDPVNGDVDFFTITVPPGATLDEIVLVSINSGNVGFLGMQAGNVFDTSTAPAGLLGFTHLGEVSGGQFGIINTNAAATGGIGFMAPLGPGDYSFWTQETSPTTPTEYCLDFQLTIPPPPPSAIPTMGEWGLINLALLMLIFGVIQIKSLEPKRALNKA